MTISNAAVGATANGYYLADKPSMLACSRLTSAKWCDTGAAADDDHTDTDYPVTALDDGHSAVYTRGNQAQQVWWLRCTLNTAQQIVDSIFMLATNLADVDTITFYASDDSTNNEITSLAKADFSAYGRLFSPALLMTGYSGTQQVQWSGCTVIKIKFDAGGGDTCRPLVWEFAAGEQCQMPIQPNYPFDPDELEGGFEETESQSGVVSTVGKYTGKRILNASFFSGSDTVDTAVLRFYRETVCGRNPFVWCRLPYSLPNVAFQMRMSNPALSRPKQALHNRTWELPAKEQGGRLYEDEV